MSKARALQRLRPEVWRLLMQSPAVDVPDDPCVLLPGVELREAAVRQYQADAATRYPWAGAADGWPGLRTMCALWNDNRPTPEQVVFRGIKAANGHDIRYAMGTSGPDWFAETFDAAGDGADCSDLLAYCLGRRKAGGPDWVTSAGEYRWLHTGSVWADAQDAQALFREVGEPRSPCVAVYPDTGSGQGHVALIISVRGKELRGVDCSSSRSRRAGDAVQVRDLSFFGTHTSALFCVPVWWPSAPTNP